VYVRVHVHTLNIFLYLKSSKKFRVIKASQNTVSTEYKTLYNYECDKTSNLMIDSVRKSSNRLYNVRCLSFTLVSTAE